MNWYVIGIVFFALVVIGCIFLLIYYIRDEKTLKEVSSRELLTFGKTYSKEEFEEKMFSMYVSILESTQYSNYNYLKDVVSDEVYNQILLSVKQNQDKKEKNVITDIKKEFSKLISFENINELEIAKVWVKYSSIEYVKGIRKAIVDDKEVESEVVVAGDKSKPVIHEYILTFVKNVTQTENIVCPSCGFQTNMLTTSRCIRCDDEVVSKKEHWVFVEKVSTNISKIN